MTVSPKQTVLRWWWWWWCLWWWWWLSVVMVVGLAMMVAVMVQNKKVTGLFMKLFITAIQSHNSS